MFINRQSQIKMNNTFEEFFYLDEGCVKITAASVGISRNRWTCIKDSEISDENYKSVMRENRFDVLPIIDPDGAVRMYFHSDKPNKYDAITRKTITFNDIIPFDTNIRDVIREFATNNRLFYFLIHQNRITGLITLGNLNCRQVQVYIYSLICELERTLSLFIRENLREKINQYIEVKAATNEECKKLLDKYYELKEQGLENDITEHLYLAHFFNIINHHKLFELLNYSRKGWKQINSINELRKSIAHPTRSIVDLSNSINKLFERIENIEDLNFRLGQFSIQMND